MEVNAGEEIKVSHLLIGCCAILDPASEAQNNCSEFSKLQRETEEKSGKFST